MAGRLDVVTYGENDKYLTLNPEGTLFHKQFTKRPNFSINYTDLNPKRETIGFGKTVKFTIPQNIGDLLKSVTLVIKANDIPDEWNLYYQDGAGVAVIEYADLIIGGTVIERLDSSYITIHKTYFNNSRQQEGIENLTGIIPSSTFSNWYGCRKTFSTKHTQKKFDFQVDLPFHFYKSTELSLPLCAITKQEVEVEIKFRDLKDVLFSKTSDIYREESVNFPFPTYYDGSWIPDKSVIFLELIKGWDRTNYSYFKYSKVPWYDNPGVSMKNAKLGKNGVSIHRYAKKYTTRDFYPYSDTYEKPSWSIFSFLQNSGAKTYDVSPWYDQIRGSIPEHYTCTDTTKTVFHSFPGLSEGSIAMRVKTGDKEFSKNAALINPYMSTQTLQALNSVYPQITTYASFSMEKTGPNILRDVFNYQVEDAYYGNGTPFTDIGKGNEKALLINWKNHGIIAGCLELGEVFAIQFGAPQDNTNFNPYHIPYSRIVQPAVFPSYVNQDNPIDSDLPLGGGFIRVFRHFTVGEGYNDAWSPDTNINGVTSSEIKNRLIEIENIESGKVLPSDVVAEGMLELHWPMHSFARDTYPWGGGPFDPKFMSSMNDVLLSPPFFQPGGPSNISADLLPPSLRGFGKVTRITSAGKAIVATLGYPNWPTDLRMFTWLPANPNGQVIGASSSAPTVPGYTIGSPDPGGANPTTSGTRSDYFGAPSGTFRLAWPNTRIDLTSREQAGLGPLSRRMSDVQMSDYWETDQYGSNFLQGRTAQQDNGSFALFWGHVRNITVAYSYIRDTESKTLPGAVLIYQWNFHNWAYYREYKHEWDKTFSLVQALSPPDTPTYNFNFGQKIAIARTSEMLIVSEPNWVPTERLTFSKTDNVDWNVGRIHVYKKTTTSSIVDVYNITASGGKFYINGVEKPIIELIEGVTYTFNNPTSGGSVPAHPFKFSETSDGTHGGGSEYTFNGSVSSVVYPYSGAPEGTFRTVFTVPVGQAGTVLHYYCQIHPGMGNSINIVAPGGKYQLHQTIYPELPSLADRTERARKMKHQLYTSWNDPIQKRWEFGKTLDLSDDDKTLIVGADSNTTLGPNKSPTDTNGGWVSIYQLNDSGDFEFKSIISQKVDEDADASFGSDNIATTIDGNDIAVSASNADWEPSSELPFKDTSFDPLNVLPNVQVDEDCGNVQLFSKDTVTPKNYKDIDIEIDTCKLKLELIHLDKIERYRIKNTPITQIITQLQVNKFNWREYQGINYDNDFVQESQNNQFRLNFCNPVKELFFVVQKNNKRSLEILQDSNTNTSELCFFQGVTDFDGFVRNYGNRETNNVFTSSKYPQPVMDSIKKLSLTLDDEEVIPINGIGEFPSHFLRAIPSSKYHTHTALNRRIYLWSFATNPESWKPSGQLNFSTIKNQILTLEGFKTGWTHQHDLSVYAKSYNIMKIENGTARILYPLIANRQSENVGNIRDFPNPYVNEVFDGNQFITHERFQPYFDPGISLSPDFTFDSSNNLNINVIGSYSFEYSVVNEHGNKNHKGFTRTVNVVDTVAPVVSLNFPSANPVNLIFNDTVSPVYFQPYVEYGAAADTGENIVTTLTRTPIGGGTTVVVTAVNPTIEGVYTVTYTATDAGENIGTNTRIVNVTRDATAPLISLNNPNQNPVNLIYNDTVTPVYSQSYIEYGATSDGGETVVIDSSAVNTTTAGTYIVTYTATDTAGNIGTITRSVIVTLDTTSPLVTLNTPNYNNVNLIYNNLTGYSQPYTEYGATSDGGETIVTTITRSPIGGGATVSVNSVNVTFEGIYTVTYTATDVSGNTGTNTRTIIVIQDIIAPTITLTNPSENPVRLTYNSTVTPVYSEPYVEYGATADGGETVVIDSSAVNVTSEGTYTVTYTATDIAGNIGTASRTVIVTEDDIDPILTLTNPSANPINLIFNDSISPTYIQPYVEYGATSDGGETVSIDSSAIQPTTPGTYNVVYSATDFAGNTGTVIRQVIYTRDTSAPIISLNNPSYNPVDLVYNSTNGYSETYTEHGATSDGGETVTQVVRRNGTVVSAVNPTQAGTYVVTYSATDSAGNIGTNTRTIIVTNDTVAPVLNLQGSSYIKVVQNYGGSLGIPNPPITINAPDQSLSYSTNSTVNMSTPGTYTITYSVTDRALNVGTVSRTVQVYSTSGATASFSLNGGNQSLTQCGTYTDGGYTGVVSDTTNTPVYSSGNLNTSASGTYTVSWTATSKVLGGNSLTRSRTVTVNAISFSPSQTIEAYSSYEPLYDSQNPWNSNLTWVDSTSTVTINGRNVTKITRSYRPKCNNNASQEVATRVIRNYFDSLLVQRSFGQVSGGDGYPITNNVSQCTIIAHTTFTSRQQSNYSRGLIARLGNLYIYSDPTSSSSRIRIGYSDNSRNYSATANLSGSYINQKLIYSLSANFVEGNPYQWRASTSTLNYQTITYTYPCGTGTCTGSYQSPYRVYTYYWRRNYTIQTRLRIYRYSGSSTYDINTHRTNGAIGSDGLPDLEYVAGTGFNSTWVHGGNNTTTTWDSRTTNPPVHNPGGYATAALAGAAALGTKKMLGSSSTATYSALQYYSNQTPVNMSAWSASNGSCVYILDRSHSGYL